MKKLLTIIAVLCLALSMTFFIGCNDESGKDDNPPETPISTEVYYANMFKSGFANGYTLSIKDLNVGSSVEQIYGYDVTDTQTVNLECAVDLSKKELYVYFDLGIDGTEDYFGYMAQTKTGVKGLVKDGEFYMCDTMEDEGEVYTQYAVVGLDNILETLLGTEPGNDIFQKLNDAVLALPNVIKNIAVVEGDKIVPVFEKIMETYFVKDENKFTLNFDAITAFVQSFKVCKLSDVVDGVLGEGTVDGINPFVQSVFDTTVSDFKAKLNSYGINIIAVLDSVLEIQPEILGAVLSSVVGDSLPLDEILGFVESFRDSLVNYDTKTLKDIIGVATVDELIGKVSEAVNTYKDVPMKELLKLDDAGIDAIVEQLGNYKNVIKLEINTLKDGTVSSMTLDLDLTAFVGTPATTKITIEKGYNEVNPTEVIGENALTLDAYATLVNDSEWLSERDYSDFYYYDKDAKTIFVSNDYSFNTITYQGSDITLFVGYFVELTEDISCVSLEWENVGNDLLDAHANLKATGNAKMCCMGYNLTGVKPVVVPDEILRIALDSDYCEPIDLGLVSVPFESNSFVNGKTGKFDNENIPACTTDGHNFELTKTETYENEESECYTVTIEYYTCSVCGEKTYYRSVKGHDSCSEISRRFDHNDGEYWAVYIVTYQCDDCGVTWEEEDCEYVYD